MYGRSSGSTIEQCGRDGTVDGNFKIGGIVGKADNSTIRSCYNKANVIGYYGEEEGKTSSGVGGIVGTTNAIRWSNND